jgi:CRISPR-associated protein Cmr3
MKCHNALVCHSGAAAHALSPKVPTRENQSNFTMERWIPSSRNQPCPICSRSKDGDCRIRQDGQMLFCHRGKTLGPPERLKAGDVVTDAEGRAWAYTGESRDDSRDGAVFVIHQESAHGLPACPPPEPAPRSSTKRNSEPCTAVTYQYRDDLRVIRYDYQSERRKDFQPQFYYNKRWNTGAGSEIWPFYGSLGGNGESFVIEVEGEKCVDILRAQGIAAITHPGHQRDEQSCRARYTGLAQANVKTVYFISDNDAAGRKKAAGFFLAAQLADVELRILPAESIHSVPDGGSVDDMPTEQLKSLIASAIKSATGQKPAPLSRVSYGRIKRSLADFLDTAPTSSADIQAGIADIASANDASVFDVKRIWDSIQEDREIEQEALSGSSAIRQRQELETKRQALRLRDYLPESICDSVEELTKNLACDPLTAISVVLTTAAGVFKAGHRIDAGDGLFVKEPVIWMLISGSSGTGKSPIMRHLCRHRLDMVFDHYNHLSLEEEERWESRYSMMPKAKRPEKPEPLSTCVSDFTTESLNRVLSDNHRNGLGTFIYSEEIKGILGNFDEYKSHGKGKGKETFLCLFDGNVDSQLRVGRRTKLVTGKVQNALLGAVQPGVFRRMIEEGDDAGLFARCLIVPLVNKYAEPNFFRSPEEIQAVHLAEQCLNNFYLRCLGVNPIVLRLEREAVELFSTLSRDTYDKSQMLSLESQRAVLGKRLGYILQIALAMQLCRVAAGEESEDEPFVSTRTIAQATVFVDLLQSYAIVEQQESQMTKHGSFDLNRRIHVYARANKGCTVGRFMAACVPTRQRSQIKPQNIKAAMEQMVAMGLGEWAEGTEKSPRFVSLGKFPD